MSNSTDTHGYLTSVSTRYNINHIVHDLIVGITGIDNTLVRPKNQNNPPPPPAFGTNWATFGISNTKADGFAFIDANQNIFRQEHYEVTCSVYGTNAEYNAKNLRDGLELQQNWEFMRPYNLGFGGSSNVMRVPELHNGRWLQRYDFVFSINQNATAKYNILTMSAAATSATINVGLYHNS